MLKRLLSCAGLTLLMVVTSEAKEWRGIVPLHSNRVDVERLLGKPNANYARYNFETEEAQILYSRAPCTQGLEGMWNVPRDTVISILVKPKGGLRLSDLNITLSKYRVVKDPLLQVHTIYDNDEEGITYNVFEGGGEAHGKVLEIYYEPTAADRHLLCPEAARQAASAACSRAKWASGNLPLSDACPVIEIVGPSGESCHHQRYSFVGNLGGIDPAFKPTYEWSVSAGTIISGQSTGMIEVDVTGIDGQSLTVTLKVGGVIPEHCPDTETYTTKCPKR